MEAKNVKGTHDIFNEEVNAYSYVENVMKSIANLFGFNEVVPPVLEHSEVFIRGVGEGSDVVRKEMYTFDDKGGRSLTLRPEFTAGIMRLITQNKLYANVELPLKYFYCGPVFRYERPQLGRYRQFNQFGVEAVGNTSAYVDIDVILLAYTTLVSLGLENVKIKINTLGDEITRDNYRKALKDYFKKDIDKMCPDCKSRFELNPLRILDCKDEDDQKIIAGAPSISDYLSLDSKVRFEGICSTLKDLDIPFEVDHTLVRGLDYYSETVFEFHYRSSLGNDYGAIGAGGHYGKLLKEMGGPDLPGVGFSFGVERIVSVLNDDNLLPNLNNELFAYVMPLGKASLTMATSVACILRSAGYSADICFDDAKMGAMFKRAEKKNAKYAVIIGENEINRNVVILKDLTKKEQKEIPVNQLVDYLDAIYEEHECHCHDDQNCECHDDKEHECCCHHHKGE